jgi:hypothetical protein
MGTTQQTSSNTSSPSSTLLPQYRPARVYVVGGWLGGQAHESMLSALRSHGYEALSLSEALAELRRGTQGIHEAVSAAMQQLAQADACVFVEPGTVNAHFALGVAKGAGKVTVAMVSLETQGYLLAAVTALAATEGEVLAALEENGLAAGVRS